MPIYGLANTLPGQDDITLPIEARETAAKLHREIAYLSKTRRQIVAMYYFENKRQQDIAKALGLPLGTVKWYLSDAKTELKKGMEKMRTSVKFNPIAFEAVFTNGSVGTLGSNSTILRGALSQNILYVTYAKAMTIHEIADALGTSPVFVESEVEFLEANGFLLKQGKGYVANALIDTMTTEYNRTESDMYRMAADLLADELFDALAADVTLGQDGVICPQGDKNFAMWALLPYAIAQSAMPAGGVSFEEVATVRPDGGENICQCLVKEPGAEPMDYSENLKIMGGPAWNESNGMKLWLMDTVWGGNRVNQHLLMYDMASFATFMDGSVLSNEDAAIMAERGYITREVEKVYTADRTMHVANNSPGSNAAAIYDPEDGSNYYGIFRDSLDIVWLNGDANRRILDIANRIRGKHHEALEKIKSMYAPQTPAHMKKAREYTMQHMFYSDGQFIIFALSKLLESGKLQLPTEAQRKSLCAVLVTA